MVWVPAVYTSPAMYLTERPVELGWPLAAGIFLVGAFFITAKNLANRERIRVQSTDGDTTVWGKAPLIIRAKYGVYWDEYRALVPWKVLPGVY